MLIAVVVFPTPPFWLTIARTWPTLLLGVVRHSVSAAQRCQCLFGVSHPTFGFGSRGRLGKKGFEVAFGGSAVAAFEQQERKAVVRSREIRIDVERVTIIPDRFLGAMRFGEGDRHVLQDLGVVRAVTERELVRCQGRVEISLPFQRHCFAQVIQALWLRAAFSIPASQATPPGHATRTL